MAPFAGDTWQYVLLGLDAVVLSLMRRWYLSKITCAEDVEAAVSYDINDEMRETLARQPGQCIPYASVEGKTKALEKPLQSQYKLNEEGVIQKLMFVEHKSTRSNGYWSDVKKVIKDQIYTTPFSLVTDDKNNDGRVMVEVAEPLSADFLMDGLTTTFDKYEPVADSLLRRGIDRIFGDVSKGYQETEKMLNVDVKVLGVGKLSLIGGKMLLEPPSDSSKKYILSTMSKNRVVSDLKHNARMIKIFMWLFGLCGAGLLGYLVYRNLRSIVQHMKMSRMHKEILEQRQRRRNQQRRQNRKVASDAAVAVDEDADDEKQNCVVCLSNPREVVLLECGHICMCGDCVLLLPEPRKCPICRKTVTRFVATYFS